MTGLTSTKFNVSSVAKAAKPSLVLRNALWLVGAQVLVAPLSVLVNAVVARYLGPTQFGSLYLATTYAAFGMMFVEWGQFGTLTGKIAEQRSRAGELLGSALVWRVGAALVVAMVVLLTCRLAGYGHSFLQIMGLALLAATLATMALAGQDAVRGFERTDFAAMSYVGQQLLAALVSISVLVVGLGLHGLLLGQIFCAAAGMIFVLAMLPRMHIPRLRVRVATAVELVRDGRVFLTFAIVLALQPLVNVAMMSHFGSAEALGWYAASCKLIGILVFPALAVGKALYPTLVRQFATSSAGSRATLHSALRALCLVVFPVALGCALFPKLGVMIFNARSYAPAEDNLRVLSVYLFLLYFSMPLSECIMASGRRGLWAAVQFSCVIMSVVADPLLIVWFQAHGGNGGLGVCIATVASEVLMLVGAVVLIPKGLLDWTVLRFMGKPALAGAAMAAVGLTVAPLNLPLGAVLAVLTYAVVLLMTGALSTQEMRNLLGRVRRVPA
jgi:O-antigen/teichoic acid export membrane protein